MNEALRPVALRPPLRGRTEVHRGDPLRSAGGATRIVAFERKSSLSLLNGWLHDQSHGAGERLSLRLFGGELFAFLAGEAIELSTLPFVAEFPGSRNPAFRLQPVECGIE